jgi:antitoxin VapB
MAETTVFQSGNSQAVRLPKEFRFTSKTVEIFRRGNEVVLREKPRTLGELLDSLPPVSEEEAKEMEADWAAISAAIKEPLPPDTRDWSWLEETPAAAVAAEKPQPQRAAKAKPGGKSRRTAR